MNAERRTYPRVNLKFIAIQLGSSVNISEGGMCVAVESPLHIDFLIDFDLLLSPPSNAAKPKSSTRIKLKGIVVWTRYSELLGKYKIGIKFTDRHYYNKAKIKSLIERYKYNNPQGFHKKKVCMFVFNNFKHDTRVLKEAKTLTSAGYLVTVVAVLDKTSSSYEEQDGFRLFRLIVNPIHIRIQRVNKKYLRAVKGMLKMVLRSGKDFLKITLRSVKYVLKMVLQPVMRLVKIVLRSVKHMLKMVLQPVIGLVEIVLRPIFNFNDFMERENKEVTRRGISFLLAVSKVFHKCCSPIVLFLVDRFYVMSNFFYQILKKTITFLLRPASFLKQKLSLFHRPISFLDYYFRSLKLIKRIPADIYHAHDLNTLPIAWWAARKNDAKLIYDSHELYLERNRFSSYTRLGKFILGRIEAFLIRRAHAVITVNNTIAKELACRYKVQIPGVVMNAPSMRSPVYITSTGNGKSLRVAIGIENDLHLILYSGGITFNRGLEKVIESLMYLPDCYLVLMGNGSDKYKAGLRALAREMGVESRFSFFGPVPSEEVTTYAACADLGIAPIKNACLSYYYCSPNKLFEYILAGLPVIASNFPEMRKVIDKYDIGYTFDPEDSRGIARVIRRVLDNRQHYQKMKQNTITASHAYNWERESKKLLGIYQTLN